MSAIPDPTGLSDGRVVLRRLAERDIGPYVAAFAADAEMARLVGYDDDPNPENVRDRVERAEERRLAGGLLELAIADAASDALLGSIWLHSYSAHHRRIEVGFWIAPEARGRGVVRAAVTLTIDWLLSACAFERVEITTTPDNDAVQSLAASLGFTREGLLRHRNFERGRRVSLVYFGLLRDEWEPAAARTKAGSRRSGV